MVSLNPPRCAFGYSAPVFEPPGTDGQTRSPATTRRGNGLPVTFIGNQSARGAANLGRRNCEPLGAMTLVTRTRQGAMHKPPGIDCSIRCREAS